MAKEILRREKFARYAPNDPFLQRIFGGACEEDGSNNAAPEDEPEGEETGDMDGIPEDGAP